MFSEQSPVAEDLATDQAAKLMLVWMRALVFRHLCAAREIGTAEATPEWPLLPVHNRVLEQELVRVEDIMAELALELKVSFPNAFTVLLTTRHLHGSFHGCCFGLISTGIWRLFLNNVC